MWWLTQAQRERRGRDKGGQRLAVPDASGTHRNPWQEMPFILYDRRCREGCEDAFDCAALRGRMHVADRVFECVKPAGCTGRIATQRGRCAWSPGRQPPYFDPRTDDRGLLMLHCRRIAGVAAFDANWRHAGLQVTGAIFPEPERDSTRRLCSGVFYQAYLSYYATGRLASYYLFNQ